MKFKLLMEDIPYDIDRKKGALIVNGRELPVKQEGNNIVISGTPHTVSLSATEACVDGIYYRFQTIGLEEKKKMRKKGGPDDLSTDTGVITAIMPGLIIDVLKKDGESVRQGEVLMVLEAMKMQNEIKASKDGILRKINVKQGESVEMKQILAVIE